MSGATKNATNSAASGSMRGVGEDVIAARRATMDGGTRELQQPLLITGRKQGSSGGGRILQPEVALRRPSRHRALADDNGHESGFPPSSTGTILVSKLFWKILVTRVNRRFAARANSFGSRAWGAWRRRHVGPSRRLQFVARVERSESRGALATRDESRMSLRSIRATSYSLISRLKRSISAPRCGLSLSQSMVRILPRSSWVLAIASVIAPSSLTFELVGITS